MKKGRGRAETMEYIFDIWKKISSNIETAQHVLLILDYDGTLTPIVDSPELAVLDEDTRNKIGVLARCSFFTIGIISGRPLADVKKRVAIDNIYYGGNHGLECESPQMKFTSPDAKEFVPLMQLVKDELVRELRYIKGLFVENKGLTLSVHYRQVRQDEISKVKRIFNNTLEPLFDEGRIKVTNGKKVLEVRPPLELDKGRAFLWMLRSVSIAHLGTLPIYIGDDQTDESAFQAVNKKKGLSIFVGENDLNSYADYYLKSPREVKEFLEQIERTVRVR